MTVRMGAQGKNKVRTFMRTKERDHVQAMMKVNNEGGIMRRGPGRDLQRNNRKMGTPHEDGRESHARVRGTGTGVNEENRNHSGKDKGVNCEEGDVEKVGRSRGKGARWTGLIEGREDRCGVDELCGKRRWQRNRCEG